MDEPIQDRPRARDMGIEIGIMLCLVTVFLVDGSTEKRYNTPRYSRCAGWIRLLHSDILLSHWLLYSLDLRMQGGES